MALVKMQVNRGLRNISGVTLTRESRRTRKNVRQKFLWLKTVLCG